MEPQLTLMCKQWGCCCKHTTMDHSFIHALLNQGQTAYLDEIHEQLLVEFRTGMVIPMVFPKRVMRVQVRYWILAHRAHCTPVPQCHRYSWVNYIIIVSIFLIILISIFLIHFIFSKVKRSEFETPTNVTNSRVCLHPPPTRSTANARSLGHHFWVSGRG